MNLQKQAIEICLTPDERYMKHAGVLMASILLNADVGEKINFYIFDDGSILPATKEKMKLVEKLAHQKQVQMTLKYIPIQVGSLFNGVPLAGYLSVATCYRLLAAQLLPHLSRVLYLDSDMLVLSSLRPLWEMDLEGNLVAMVADSNYLALNQKYGFKEGEFYCNDGMLLFDLTLFRKGDYLNKVIQAIQIYQDQITLGIQDVNNLVFRGSIKYLDYDWNLQETSKTFKKLKWNQKLLDACHRQPHIIHYITAEKPWNPRVRRFSKTHYYFDYLKLTPWKNYVWTYWFKRIVFYYFLDNILEIHQDNSLFYIKIFKIRVFKKIKQIK